MRVSGLLTLLVLFAIGCLQACSQGPWNSPWPNTQAGENHIYSSFQERPKHLDPVRSYSSNEYTFIAQIYEPPLQYHFLKRPYELIPLTTEGMPSVRYFDANCRSLPKTANPGTIATSEYTIQIQPGIMFQPHPAFAKNDSGALHYYPLSQEKLEHIDTLNDFEHSGTRELTAQDYIYQIKRMANARLHSPIAGVLAEYIIGFKEFQQTLATAYESHADQEHVWLDLRDYDMSGVELIDRYTFRIRLKGKYPQFQYWMALPFFAPMPWEAERFYAQPGMEERNISLHWYPVGTGPFMLSTNDPNLRMVLERNPNFHGERYPVEGEPGDSAAGLLADAGKPMPFVDKAIYGLERETIPYWNKFLQGYYDVSSISSDSFDQAVQFNSQGEVGLTEQMQEKGIELATSVNTSIFYMGFNMLNDVVGGTSQRARNLRHAISIAVNYEEYISIFANGRGLPAQGPIPPGIWGHHEGEAGINPYVYGWEDGMPKRRSIEVARELMTAAGYPGGIDERTGQPLVLYFDTTGSGPDAKASLNWMRKQYKKLGIELVIRNTDYNRFQDKMRNGTAQIYQWGWNADYPDPENFLFLLYGPNSKVKHGGENASNYSNPQFDSLFTQMKNMENGPERQAIIDRMVEILRHDAPWLWGFHPKSFALYHGWYHNVKPNLMANNTLKYTRIDPQQRASKRNQWNNPVLWPLWILAIILVLSVLPAVVGYIRRERSTIA